MEHHTFRSRLAKLAQKSKRALKLYSSLHRSIGGRKPLLGVRSQSNQYPVDKILDITASDYSELQAFQWHKVNEDLLRELSHALNEPSARLVTRDVFILRDRLFEEWRGWESDIQRKQRESIFASENGDFVKAALLSQELIKLKALLQATQAAHHELTYVIKSSRIAERPEGLLEQVVAGATNNFQNAYNDGQLSPTVDGDSEAGSDHLKVVPIKKRFGGR